MSPFFSIITPVYNRQKLVGETIETILNQEYTNFELILVDDKSTDDSLKVLEEYAKKTPKVKVIALDENRGRCYARNKGLSLAKGEWICYLDSDDFYYPNHLSTFKQLIEEFPQQKAFASEQTFNKQAKEYNKAKFKQNLVELTIEDFIESNPISANQLCYRRDLGVNWSKERIPIAEDWLFHRMLSLQTSILKKNVVTTDVRFHDERSITQSSIDNFVYWNLHAANAFIAFNAENKGNVNGRVKSYIQLLCANIYLSNGIKKKGFKLLLKGLMSVHALRNSLSYKGILKVVSPIKL